MEQALYNLLRHGSKPNTTLYLIWHYVVNNQLDYAKAEFARDGDKLFPFRQLVKNILYEGDAS